MILCRYKSRRRIIIADGEPGSSYGHDPDLGISGHSDVNYQHWSVQGCNAAIILNLQNVLAERSGKIDAALVSFEIALELEKIPTEGES